MLKNIDPLLTSPLLAALRAMGHGDVLAVVDRNFPAASNARQLVELPGADTTQAVRAILSVFPVDTFEEPAAFHMHPVDQPMERGPAYGDFEAALRDAEARPVAIAGIDRHEFYRRSQSAYCIVSTSDTRPYACFLVVKGVVTGA